MTPLALEAVSSFSLIPPSPVKRAVVFEPLKAIYIENGRVASTSIKYIFGRASGIPDEVIRDLGFGNMTSLDLNDEKYSEYLKFTFVRNPWDRIVSTYISKIMKPLDRGKGTFYLEEMKKHTGTDDVTFENFLRYVDLFRDTAEGCDTHWRSQYQSVFNEKFQPIVDFIGYYENFNDDISSIAKIVGAEIDIINAYGAQRVPEYASYFNEVTRSYVNERYKYDIEFFGYEYDKPGMTPNPQQ